MLEEILSDSDKSRKFVQVCAGLARHYQFDGWLLNIENNLEPSLVPRLLQLLHSLSMAVKEDGQEGTVLWYDSLTHQVSIMRSDIKGAAFD